MNQPALQYKPLRTTLIESTPADELAEGLYKTFWKGSSQVDFGYLLDIAEDVPLEVIQSAPEEEGDFLIEDLRNDDIKMLKPGAVFRWVIGYVIKRDGTKRRSSDIVFRRLPQWTQNDITEADKEAEKLFGEID